LLGLSIDQLNDVGGFPATSRPHLWQCVARLGEFLTAELGEEDTFAIYSGKDFVGRVRSVVPEHVILAFDDGTPFGCPVCRCPSHFVGPGLLGLVQHHEDSVGELERKAVVLVVLKNLTSVNLPEVRYLWVREDTGELVLGTLRAMCNRCHRTRHGCREVCPDGQQASIRSRCEGCDAMHMVWALSGKKLGSAHLGTCQSTSAQCPVRQSICPSGVAFLQGRSGTACSDTRRGD
jgi:hypothetical protein